jgi:hypothetical protein
VSVLLFGFVGAAANFRSATATALRKWRFVRKQSAPNRAFSPHICLNFERLIQRHDHIVNSSGSDGATITLIPFARCSSADTRAIIANIIAISFQFLHFGLNKDRYTVNLKAQRGIRGYGFRMHRRPSSQLCKLHPSGLLQTGRCCGLSP